MKTLFKVLPIVFLSTLASHTAQAEIEHETKKSIALVSSGIIGGLLGDDLDSTPVTLDKIFS